MSNNLREVGEFGNGGAGIKEGLCDHCSAPHQAEIYWITLTVPLSCFCKKYFADTLEFLEMKRIQSIPKCLI